MPASTSEALLPLLVSGNVRVRDADPLGTP
jgi:hypothetical protein